MSNSRASVLGFLAATVFAVSYVVATSGALPPTVASHFDGAGRANGFMSRSGYVGFSVGFALVLPVLVGVVMPRAIMSAPELLNLPNKDYWLAPKRAADTFTFLATHNRWLGTAMALFAAGLHRSIVRANAQAAPSLAGDDFTVAMIAFSVVMTIWIGLLLARFRRPSSAVV